MDTDTFAERVLQANLGAQQMQAMYLGDRLGWYRALADEALTSHELARRTGTSERYAREWLQHQAVCGWITPDEDGAFRLPAEHAAVLVDGDSLAYLAPLGRLLAAVRLPALVDAYRTGGGVSWEDLGADAREAQAALNRPMFLHQLTQDLLPSVPSIHAALSAGARVADVGCGEGWSSIGLALGYPELRVDGLDVDRPSIEAARRNAAAYDVADRVTFTQVDATGSHEGTDEGTYDAVFAFECVHDLGDPVGFLTTLRTLAAPGAPAVVMDEKTRDAFEPVEDDLEQMLYGWSLTVCLPDGLSHPGSAGTGTVMRASTLETYALAAGFVKAEVLPVEHDMFRFYRLQ